MAARSKTNRKSEEKPLAQMDPLHDEIVKIELMPGVQEDLAEIKRHGADRVLVVRRLASIARSRRVQRVTSALSRRETMLKGLASELNNLAERADQMVEDPYSNVTAWFEVLGLRSQFGRVHTPQGPGEEMHFCAGWLSKNASVLRQLRLALRKTEDTDGTISLMYYVLESTGKFRDALVARLLNAAVDAVGNDETFSEEGLKKMRQRESRRQSQRRAQLAKIPRDLFWDWKREILRNLRDAKSPDPPSQSHCSNQEGDN